MSATKLETLMPYFIQQDVDIAMRAFFDLMGRSGDVNQVDMCLPSDKPQSAFYLEAS